MKFQLLRKMWRRSMSHISSISGMGEPVQAIRVINEKRMLLIMVGCKVSMGIHLQARVGDFGFLTVEEI
jgi:hypothetical protein